jgi:hypothetical protein
MKIQIDLKANPEVANLIADMEMGEKVKFLTSLQSRDGALAEFTLDKCVECSEEDKKEHYSDADEGESEEEAEVDGDEMKTHSKMPAPGGSKNTPGGSVEQDRLAAAMSAQI